ncbi:MAG: GntP family permease [Cyclobacteriaceae bacterium]|jgi:GntP family gluconate:H+ symporter|nr:GntP family permease [Cyclobacteriaceae bacterium]
MLVFISIVIAVIFIIITSSVFKWHPFFSLLLTSFGVGFMNGLPFAQIIETVSTGFGTLIGNIGILIILGCLLGQQLESSGGIQFLAKKILATIGSKKPSLFLSMFGALLGIPVFCDSGYIILINLAKSISFQSAIPVESTSLSLASGLYTTHTLVPPTPGPIAAAGNLGISASLGLVMIVGLIVSIPTAFAGYWYAHWFGKKNNSKHSAPMQTEIPANNTNQEKLANKALMLILLPLSLISLAALVKILNSNGTIASIIIFLGQPIVALLLTVCLGFFIFKLKAFKLSEKSILQAGPIIILTGCGGAFGAVLKATALSEILQSFMHISNATGLLFLFVSFLAAAIFKTAQGSSTSSLIITSSIVSPLAVQGGFTSPLSLALLVTAIGAGAMAVSHTNDSYFWVVSRFSGLSLKQTFTGFSVLTAIQGLIALLTTFILYLVLL